jgi:hypothetical protein
MREIQVSASLESSLALATEDSKRRRAKRNVVVTKRSCDGGFATLDFYQRPSTARRNSSGYEEMRALL